MHIVHLLSNRKWTERAEPVTDLVRAQQRLGHAATLVCGRWRRRRGQENSVAVQARHKGLEPVVLEMHKHFRLVGACRDVPRLRRLMATESPPILHAHMANAHLLAAWACRGRPNPPLIIRSSYEVQGVEGGLRASALHRGHTAGLIVIGRQAQRASQQRFGLSPDQVEVIEPGIDVDFFAPDRPVSGAGADFGWQSHHFVLGVVARLRPDRRIDVPVDALRVLAPRHPDLRLLLVGRGESRTELELKIQKWDLADRVVFAGYRRGDDLVSAYRSMQVLLYPAPGTDQSCRTVREAMAAGVPVIGSRTGFIPELIEDGTTGRIVDLDAEAFAQAVQGLYEDRAKLAEMRQRCVDIARQRFSLSVQAQRTIGFYQRVLAKAGNGTIEQ